MLGGHIFICVQAYEQEKKTYQQQSVFVPWKIKSTGSTIQNGSAGKKKKDMKSVENTNNIKCQAPDCQNPLINPKYLYCQTCHAEKAKIEYTLKKNNKKEPSQVSSTNSNDETKDLKCVNRYFYLFQKKELENLAHQFENVKLVESMIEGSKLYVILEKIS